jgi:sugar/nucleoside kinase (ribokinase family)
MTADVCVIGNLNIDLLIRGMATLPEWGREVVGTEHHSFAAGQAGYLALGLGALETPVSVVGVVGADDAGERIVRAFVEAGVDVSGVTKIAGQRTGITVALVRPDGERAFASDIGCSAQLTEALVRDASGLNGRASLLAVVGVFMLPHFPIAHIRALLADCRGRGVRTALDTGWDPAGWEAQTISDLSGLLSEVDLFLPNLDEARAITRQSEPAAALRALAGLCAGSVVIKCGKDGSLAWHEGQVLAHPAFSANVVDTVGAGDSFNAGLLAALADGRPFEVALVQGHAFASLYVSRRDNRFARKSELAAFLASARQS